MLATRVLTAVVLLVVLVPLLFFGSNGLIDWLALALCAFASWEWWRLLGHRRMSAWLGAALVIGVSVVGWAAGDVFVRVALVAVTAFWCVVAPWWLHAGVEGPTRRRALAVVGVFAIAAVWWSLQAAVERGPIYVLSILGVVWVSDIAAYFVGRAFGRHKLAPHISPGKTWEGAVGAVVVTAAAAWIAARIGAPMDTPNFVVQLFADRSPVMAIVAVCALVSLGIVGDLFESLLKRKAGVKDSGRCLPGHGGLLDRIDALIPVLPAAVLIEWLTRRL